MAHPLNFLLCLVEEVGDRAGVADVPVTLKRNTDLNRLVAPQVTPDIPESITRHVSTLPCVGFGNFGQVEGCWPGRAREVRGRVRLTSPELL